jgi:mannose-1-phosphate guanylyltransferase/mannose-6-phosphate isomerase
MQDGPMLHPVILSGGSGTRLWPMSRSLHPKQLLSLVGHHSLLQQTVLRVAGQAGFAAPVVVANEEHRFLIAEQLREIGVAPDALLLEPIGRNTAPACAVAALHLVAADPDALMLVLPSDHAVDDPAALRAAVALAEHAARAGYLVTFGVRPERAETGFGYIARGNPLSDFVGVYAAAGFVEKPDAEHAARFIAEGEHCWNSGIFLFKAAEFLGELAQRHPDMVTACREALEQGRDDADFLRLDKDAFAACPSDSIDYAVMEHTGRAAMVPVTMGWSDLGSWDALWEMSPKDAHGNVLEGDVIAEESQNCYLRSEGRLVAAIGIKDLVVVATRDAVMLAPRSRAQDVKGLVARLARDGRDEADSLPTVHRPWGTYTGIHQGERVQVKHIVVKPGGKLSLQRHRFRAEHWVVVQGTAKIRRGDDEFTLSEDQSTYIPLHTLHRLENPGDAPLHLIEVQSGSYLGEDDIERFDDDYGRE